MALDKLGVLDRFKHKVVASRPVEKIIAAPTRLKQVPVLPPPTIIEVREQPPETIAAVPASPVNVLPKTLDLPNYLDLDVVTLVEIPTATGFSITSADGRLVLKGKTLRWHADPETSEPIAGLTIRDGKLIFRWLTDAPDGGVAAVHNSVLRIERPSGTETLAMRTPVFVDPVRLNFKKSLTRISCNCVNPPAQGDVLFSFKADPTFPAFTADRNGLSQMKVQSESIARFSGTEGVATKFTMRKIGNIVAVDLHTRYKLPSGYEGSLTFANGKKKSKELEKLLFQANEAASNLRDLQKARSRNESELRRWQYMSTIRYFRNVRVQDPILVAQRNTGINNARKTLTRTEAMISRTEQLIADRPKIEEEIRAT